MAALYKNMESETSPFPEVFQKVFPEISSLANDNEWRGILGSKKMVADKLPDDVYNTKCIEKLAIHVHSPLT